MIAFSTALELLSRPDVDRNVIKRFFLEPGRRTDGGFGRELVAGLRVASAQYRDDPAVQELIGAGVDHGVGDRQLWDARLVNVEPSATKRIEHPVIGMIELDCEALHDPPVISG